MWRDDGVQKQVKLMVHQSLFYQGFFSAVSWSASGGDPVYVFDHSVQKIERCAPIF
jgi:hypothetical protein